MYFCVEVNNTVIVNVGQDVTVNREGVELTINCTQLINDKIKSGVQNPTVKWYKDGINLTTGSVPNVAISNDGSLCVITSTLLTMGGQSGTGGNYTCEVCNTTNCISETSTHIVCGKKDCFNNYMTYVCICYVYR